MQKWQGYPGNLTILDIEIGRLVLNLTLFKQNGGKFFAAGKNTLFDYRYFTAGRLQLRTKVD